MIYYHYSTWEGKLIVLNRLIKPKANYGFITDSIDEPWPEIVFLTQNSAWEPSIQAYGPEEDSSYSKGPSNPISYRKQGIPCWRFSVEIPDNEIKVIPDHPLWLSMLKDAKNLGSDLSLWHWTNKPLPVLESFIWGKDNYWIKL